MDRVKELGYVSKTEIVRACGYCTTAKDGKERTNFTAFYEELLKAKGLDFSVEKQKQGRRANYRIRVYKNGSLMIGYFYTKKLELEPGDEFKIRLGRNKITLMPVGGSDEGD